MTIIGMTCYFNFKPSRKPITQMEAHIQESRSLKDINTTELTIIFARNITHRYMIQQIGRACTLYK